MLLSKSEQLEKKLAVVVHEKDDVEVECDKLRWTLTQTEAKLEEIEAKCQSQEAKLKQALAKIVVQERAPLEQDTSDQVNVLERDLMKKSKLLETKAADCREQKKEIDQLHSELNLQRESAERMSLALSRAEGKRKCDATNFERRLTAFKSLVNDTNCARDDSAAELERLSELTVTLKRKLLDAEQVNIIQVDDSQEFTKMSSGDSFNPYLKRVLMLLSSQVSRLELDLEMR